MLLIPVDETFYTRNAEVICNLSFWYLTAFLQTLMLVKGR